MKGFEIYFGAEVYEWWEEIVATSPEAAEQIAAAFDLLSEEGPSLGRPLVDLIQQSQIPNLKGLRPPTPGRSKVRILFVFDPNRNAILLVAGDKSGSWNNWYKKNIPLAEKRYKKHLHEVGLE